MERVRTISLTGGKEATAAGRDVEGMGTGRAEDSSSAKGILGNKLWEKIKGGFMHSSTCPSSEDLAHFWEHHFQ